MDCNKHCLDNMDTSYYMLLHYMFCNRRDGRGSIFLHPTQSNPSTYGPNPTVPIDGPNPCPSLCNRDAFLIPTSFK